MGRIVLKVCLPSGTSHRLALTAGCSVRDALDETEWRVRAACGGSGACGACVVRLLEGAANPLTLAEYQKLTPEERQRGVRLACQLRPSGDLTILLEQPAWPSRWRSVSADDLIASPGTSPGLTRHIYGVAVDLGTTHIRVSLWDRKQGRRIASRRGPNPQDVFGADILNRLDRVLLHPIRADELATMARAAIVQAVRDILQRDVGEVTPMLAEIGRVLIVGNTAMLALLTGRGAEALMDPGNWQRAIDCRPHDYLAWREQWYLPNAEILLPAPVGGFVGSDLLADLIATRTTGGPAGQMLLDLGTNTEIALWDGEGLLITSVPGGPAFEGVGIRNGMPAEPGAICRVRAGPQPLAYDCDTVAGDTPRGICGSGLLDAVAVLLSEGALKPSGRFARPTGPAGIALIPGNPKSALTGGDVDAFQRAKAATSAAMSVLLEQAGMGWADIGRLSICGAFGRHLEIGNAQAVGLLPPIRPSRIELMAEAALAGCERALLNDGELAMLQGLAGKARTLNLSLVQGYEDLYIDQLRLRPISAMT